jgi:hypothetical protein
MQRVPYIYLKIRDQVLTACSEPAMQVSYQDRVVTLFGEINYVADFQAIALCPPTRVQISDVLKKWCSSPDLLCDVHWLTKLVGR